MSTRSQLQQARPRLRLVSPLVFWICVIYIILNLAIGLDFILEFDKLRVAASLIIVNNLTDYHFWGVVFLSLSGVKAYALWKNNWQLIRNMLLVGVAVKAAWAIALLVRIFIAPGTILIALLWVALAMIQIITYIFFMPPLPGFGLRDDRTEQEVSDGRK